MLRPACLHEPELLSLYAEAMATERCRHFTLGGYSVFELPVHRSDWDQVQRVSYCPRRREVVGYLSAHVDRDGRQVDELQVVRFTDGPDATFASDFLAYFRLVREGLGLRKVRFSCVDGNPALALYEAAARRYPIRKIGVAYDEVLRPDGTTSDLHLFEVPCRAGGPRT